MRKLLKPLSLIILLALSISNAFAADVVIYLTRHGKTMFNTTHRVQGWSDTPLTQPGIEVAEQLGRGLKGIDFVATYSSDLGRARQTARVALAAKGTPMEIHEMEGLRETCFGIYEGDHDPNMWGPAAKGIGYESDAALMKDFSLGKISINKMVNALAAVDTSGDSENYQMVRDRMHASLKAIAEKTKAQGGGNVFVVSHGMAIMIATHEMLEKPATGQLKNASVTKLRYTGNGKFIVEAIDDMSYVEKGKLTK